MSQYLQKIMEYNLEYGFIQEQLMAMVEENSNLELIVKDRESLNNKEFMSHLGVAKNTSPRLSDSKIEDLETVLINECTIKKKKVRNKSYGENNVILYLFDIFYNCTYVGTFIIRHGSESGTYYALKRYEAMHNLIKAQNYK